MQYFVLTIFFFYFSGCIVNPKYDNANIYFQEKARQDPQNAEQYRRSAQEIESEKNVIKLQQKSNTYDIRVQDTPNTNTINENSNAFFVLAPISLFEKKKYLHIIDMNLKCSIENLFSVPIKRQKIKWKLSETIFGDIESDSRGFIHIVINSTQESPYSSIEIQTLNNIYIFSLLSSPLIYEVKSTDC